MVEARRLTVTHDVLYFSKSDEWPCPVSSISQLALKSNQVVSRFKVASPPSCSLVSHLDFLSSIFVFQLEWNFKSAYLLLSTLRPTELCPNSRTRSQVPRKNSALTLCISYCFLSILWPPWMKARTKVSPCCWPPTCYTLCLKCLLSDLFLASSFEINVRSQVRSHFPGSLSWPPWCAPTARPTYPVRALITPDPSLKQILQVPDLFAAFTSLCSHSL